MSESTLDLGIPPEQAFRLAGWAEKGMTHPSVSQYKHGDFLNDQGDGTFTADFFGFALVGQFGDPAVAFEQLRACDGELTRLAALFQVEQDKIQGIMVLVGGEQDFFNVGTKTIISMIRNCHSQPVETSPTTPA